MPQFTDDATSPWVTDEELAAAVEGGETVDEAAIAATATAAALEAVAAYSAISAKGFVNHGAVAATERPTEYASVEWVGSVEPTNAEDDDTWIDTSV